MAIPSFVVEIISEHDDIRKAEIKLLEYFKAGVAVVWRVLLEVNAVYVFISPKTVAIYSDEDIITAAPAIPDLSMSADDLFGGDNYFFLCFRHQRIKNQPIPPKTTATGRK